MDAASTRACMTTIQRAFQTLAILELTKHLYPITAEVKNGSTFDFIVVGAGTAGSVVAGRLAEDKKSQVLLIEAGGDPPFEDSIPKLVGLFERNSVDWNYTTEPISCFNNCRRNRRIDLRLGKMLGGTSETDYLLYNEGNHFDYNSWAAAADDSRWNVDGILPYLIKSQKLLDTAIQNSSDQHLFGYEGPILLSKEDRSRVFEYLKAFEELSYPIVRDVNVKRSIGYTSSMYRLGNGIRQNTALKYISPIKDYPNFKVLKNTVVTKIMFDNFNNAIGVKARIKYGEHIILKAGKEIILSAGVVNSPKLLMLSGIGPKNHLSNLGIRVRSDLPVGRNFQDHTCAVIIHSMRNTPLNTIHPNPNQYPAITFSGFVSLNKSQPYPDYQANNFIIDVYGFMPYCTETSGFSDKICNNLFIGSGGNTIHNMNELLYTELVNLHPEAKGKVLLRSSNFDDPPIVRMNYYSKKVDLDNHAKYIKDFTRVLATQTFQNMKAVWVDPQLRQCGRFDKKSIDYWRCYGKCMKTSYYDYCGTCALGSVVDSKLRVKGVKRLRVADASVIPKVPRFQVMGSVIMIGEKAADIIKKYYKL